MKKSLLLIVGLVVMSKAFAQIAEKPFKEINAPNFLVHNQLTPELLKVEYAASLGAGTFNNQAGEKISRFKQNTFTISGYPLTLINKREQQMYLGFGYIQDKYASLDNGAPSYLHDTFQSVNLNIFLNTRIKGKFYWFSYLQAGVQGSNPFDEITKSHQEIFMNKINYKANRNMNIGLGVMYASNLGNPMILPAIAFVYSQPHYIINIDFPVKAEVEGIFADGKWRPVAGVLFPSNTYNARKSNQYFSTSGLTGYVGMRYRVLDMLYLHAAWQAGLGETFKSGERGELNKIGTYEGQSRFVVSLNVQVARLIPSMRD